MVKWTLATLAVVSMALVSQAGFSAEPKPYEVSKILRLDVQNPQGEHLGTVNDLIADGEGRIILAVLLVEGPRKGDMKRVAVPYTSLSAAPSGNYLLFSATRDQLTYAPAYKEESLGAGDAAEAAYRYFGIQPPWGDELSPGTPTYNDPYDLMVKK